MKKYFLVKWKINIKKNYFSFILFKKHFSKLKKKTKVVFIFFFIFFLFKTIYENIFF